VALLGRGASGRISLTLDEGNPPTGSALSPEAMMEPSFGPNPVSGCLREAFPRRGLIHML
jgi:hypothetical protein